MTDEVTFLNNEELEQIKSTRELMSTLMKRLTCAYVKSDDSEFSYDVGMAKQAADVAKDALFDVMNVIHSHRLQRLGDY